MRLVCVCAPEGNCYSLSLFHGTGSSGLEEFRQLHSTACGKLQELCAEWEGKATSLEEQDTAVPDMEEGEGVLGGCVVENLMRE